MHKLVKIHCGNEACNKIFLPSSEKNKYCCRECFKKDYHKRKKAENIGVRKFPFFECPNCGQRIFLDYDPAKHTLRWLDYIKSCPGCNTLVIFVKEDIITKDEPNEKS